MLDDRPYMREGFRQGWSVTTILLVANALCFLLQMALEPRMPHFDQLFALSPWGIAHGYVWQLITFQFLHGGLWHLLGNLLGLYFFGHALEQMLGSKSLLKLYFLSGTIGGLVQVGLGFLYPARFGSFVLGASAGVFGLIGAFATLAPNQIITLLVFFILPVSFRARVFLYIAAGLAVFGLVADSGSIAHAAHLGGMVTGILYAYWTSHPYSFPDLPWKGRSRSSRSDDSRWSFAPKKKENLPPAEFISREVDPILEKISAQGIHSLTEQERRILEAARTRMAKR